jgi:transcriptional regulator with XRE-family HTH domain
VKIKKHINESRHTGRYSAFFSSPAIPHRVINASLAGSLHRAIKHPLKFNHFFDSRHSAIIVPKGISNCLQHSNRSFEKCSGLCQCGSVNRLREFRKAKGLSQESLSKLCGCVSQSAISKHEEGEKYIADLSKLYVIAKVLECPTADLIEPNLHIKPEVLMDLFLAWVKGSTLDIATKERLHTFVDLIKKDLPKDPSKK